MPLVEVGGAAGGAVNVMAALMLALYVTSAFGRSRRSVRRSAVVVALLVGLAAVGAAWVIPAGAGVTLWAYISVVFGSFAKVRRRLLFSALALAVFAALGAGWVLIPSGVFAVLRLWNLLGAGSGEARCQASFPSKPTSHRPVDLGKQEVDDRVRPDQDNKKEPTLDGYLRDHRLPDDARSLLHEIDGRSRAAGQYLQQQGRGNGLDGIEVERIREDYAVGAVRGYLALPTWSAQGQVLSDGKTGSQLLSEQLRLLVHRLEEIQHAAAVNGGAELLTHGKFLRDRFSGGSGDQLRL